MKKLLVKKLLLILINKLFIKKYKFNIIFIMLILISKKINF